jgi:hypothetical protein
MAGRGDLASQTHAKQLELERSSGRGRGLWSWGAALGWCTGCACWLFGGRGGGGGRTASDTSSVMGSGNTALLYFGPRRMSSSTL